MITGKVLLVEDEIITYMMMKKELEDAGFEVCDNAVDQASALDVYRSQKPDLIIMDINLARGSNGIDTAIAIKALDPAAVIIFMTGYEDEETRTRAMATGATEYLIKPVSSHQLVGIIKSL